MMHSQDLQKLEGVLSPSHLELLEDSLEERLEKTGFFLSDSEKTEGETKEGGMDGNKKRSIDGGKRGASIKKSKRMKLLVQQLKLFVLRLIQNLQHHK